MSEIRIDTDKVSGVSVEVWPWGDVEISGGTVYGEGGIVITQSREGG